MSYTTARAQIVSIIQGATPTVRPATFGKRFTHEREAIVEDIPHSRAFNIRAVAMMSDPRGHTGARQTMFEVTASVYYRETSDSQAIDEAIASDYGVIREALLDESGWARPASSIVNIATGGDAVLVSSVSDVDAGSVLDITFPLTITAGS